MAAETARIAQVLESGMYKKGITTASQIDTSYDNSSDSRKWTQEELNAHFNVGEGWDSTAGTWKSIIGGNRFFNGIVRSITTTVDVTITTGYSPQTNDLLLLSIGNSGVPANAKISFNGISSPNYPIYYENSAIVANIIVANSLSLLQFDSSSHWNVISVAIARNFDSTPTLNSPNLLTSGSIYTAIQDAGGEVIWDLGSSSSPSFTGHTWSDLVAIVGSTKELLLNYGGQIYECSKITYSNNTPSSYTFTSTEIDSGGVSTGTLSLTSGGGGSILCTVNTTQLQTRITTDTTPIKSSTNPITSGGVYGALFIYTSGAKSGTNHPVTALSPVVGKYYYIKMTAVGANNDTLAGNQIVDSSYAAVTWNAGDVLHVMYQEYQNSGSTAYRFILLDKSTTIYESMGNLSNILGDINTILSSIVGE